ncbi:GAD-like domain-containing protein [Marinomonas gallaica]|uniref:GAD-like domain-containing protein n=1 Tax=Marinomonas gallaica TaxID=1806667 RepID=UPI003CE4DC77
MSYKPDEEFDYFLEKFGLPEFSEAVPDKVFEKYRGKLPEQLFIYWREYGFCTFKKGLFSLVNPDDYHHLMTEWIHRTEAFKEDSFHVIARSGFGDLFLWGEKAGDSYIIESKDSCLYKTDGYPDLISKGQENKAVQFFFGSKSPEDIDLKDAETGGGIFNQAVKKYGPLKADEMFTFAPALFLGGEKIIGNIKKENVYIQLDILAKMGVPEILDLDTLTKRAFGVDS